MQQVGSHTVRKEMVAVSNRVQRVSEVARREVEQGRIENDVRNGSPLVRAVGRLAIANDCHAQLVEKTGFPETGYHKRLVEINGKLCYLQEARLIYQPNEDYDTLYTRSAVTPRVVSRCDVSIFYRNLFGYKEEAFIYPASVFSSHQGSDRVNLYIPIGVQRRYRIRTDGIDHDVYRNAWHLISEIH